MSDKENKKEAEPKTLEEEVLQIIKEKSNDGTIKKQIEDGLTTGINNAMDNLFRSYGDITKIIEKKVKEVMIPYLEKYDYSSYIVKLDSILTDVLEESTLENRKILENFKELISNAPVKRIKTSELFEKWTEFVSKNVEVNGLEICYDDEVSYQNVEVSGQVEYEDRHFGSYEDADLVFECEHDENMNFKIRLFRSKNSEDKSWSILRTSLRDFNSLRDLNSFSILIMSLQRNFAKIEIDEDNFSDDVEPEEKPEPSYD